MNSRCIPTFEAHIERQLKTIVRSIFSASELLAQRTGFLQEGIQYQKKNQTISLPCSI